MDHVSPLEVDQVLGDEHEIMSTGYTNPGTMPYSKSKDLVGWEFKSGCNPGYGSGRDHKSSSADTFFPSWAADNKLYWPGAT